MYKKIVLISCILILLLLPNFSYASVTNYTATNIDSFTNSQFAKQAMEKKEELSDIISQSFEKSKEIFYKYQKYFFKNKLTINNKDEIFFGEPYKVYTIENPAETIKALSNGINFLDIINYNNYYWEVPVYTKSYGNKIPISTIQIRKTPSNQSWHLSTINGYLEPSLSDICSDKDKLIGLLKSNNLTNVDNVVHFNLLNMDFLYVLTNNNEIFIPLFICNSSRLKYLEVNDKSQFISFLTELNNNFGGTGGIGSIKINRTLSNVNIMLKDGLIISISLIIIFSIIYYYNSYNSKYKGSI